MFSTNEQVFKNEAFLIALKHILLTVYWHFKLTMAIFWERSSFITIYYHSLNVSLSTVPEQPLTSLIRGVGQQLSGLSLGISCRLSDFQSSHQTVRAT